MPRCWNWLLWIYFMSSNIDFLCVTKRVTALREIVRETRSCRHTKLKLNFNRNTHASGTLSCRHLMIISSLFNNYPLISNK